MGFLKSSVLSIAFVSLIVGCSPTSENGFFGDQTKSSECPSSGCVDATAVSQNILMSSNLSNTRVDHKNPAGSGNRFEVSGQCSTSTFPYNSIEVFVYPGCSGISGSAYTGISVQSVIGDTQPHCERGKFNLAMKMEAVPVSSCSTVTVALKAGFSADTGQHTYRNDSAGKFTFNYVRNP